MSKPQQCEHRVYRRILGERGELDPVWCVSCGALGTPERDESIGALTPEEAQEFTGIRYRWELPLRALWRAVQERFVS